jgi:cytoskeletal protein CcmA (bactofilin family)
MFGKNFFVLSFVVLIVLLLPGIASAKSLTNDQVIVGESFLLGSGETFEGNLVVFGGLVTTEQDSLFVGDVVVLGGSGSINGQLDGNLVVVGGTLKLGSRAWVRGNVSAVATTIDRDVNARISGQLITGRNIRVWETARVVVPDFSRTFDVRSVPGFDVLGLLLRSILWAALAILVILFLQVPTERVSQTIVAQPLLSGGVGLLAVILAVLILLAMAITLILIPVSVLGVFILIVTWTYGRIALGLEVGRRFSEILKKDWPIAVHAGIGTFILVLVVDGANMVIPCVGGIFSLLVGLVGLGGVLLSRYGSQVYSPVPSGVVNTPPSKSASSEGPKADVPPEEK